MVCVVRGHEPWRDRVWRREWDLNPRCPEAQRFSRPSDSAALASLRRRDYRARCVAKKVLSSSDTRSRCTPAVTSTSWLRRGGAPRVLGEPPPPGLGGGAPQTRRVAPRPAAAPPP